MPLRSACRLRLFLLGAILGAAAAVAAGTEPATARDGVAIERVEASRRDSLLVCRLVTRGLPDPASRETLESGLPCAVRVETALLDEAGEPLADLRTSIRIEPDLWERIFVIRMPLFDRRVETIEEVAAILSDLGPIPVALLVGLPARDPVRIRARLAVDPLAPEQERRVRGLFGAEEARAGEPDRREISIGIGALLRHFLHAEEGDWIAEAVSSRLLIGAVPEETGE